MALKPEQIDHINTRLWFEHKFPELADDFHHFANERKCSQYEGRVLKKMGVKRGVLDFHLALPCGNFHGLWLELKVGRGKLLPEQIDFMERKNARGYLATAAWGFSEAQEKIMSYLTPYISNS